ncbi:hypothetical protein AC1031_002445 [Aphanomyces cochlioides]|nr:hypothetical protein AC1031_002445 [Aphanomyces cochlioides]
MPDDSEYERIEICTKIVDCQGQDESECYTVLENNLRKSTYWHSDYAFFPFINALAICDAYQRGHNEPEKIVAFIQLTTQDKRKFKQKHWKKLLTAVH